MHPDIQRLAKYHNERSKRFGGQMNKLIFKYRLTWFDALLAVEFIIACAVIVYVTADMIVWAR